MSNMGWIGFWHDDVVLGYRYLDSKLVYYLGNDGVGAVVKKSLTVAYVSRSS